MQCIIQHAPVDYTDEGEGPAILFVHGWGDQKGTWRPLIEVLKTSYRCIALDLPNFGASGENARCVTLEDYSRFLGVFLEKVSISQYALVGHSMGGQIGIYAVGQQLLTPTKLVLIAAAGVRDDKTARRKILKAGAVVFRRLVPPAAKKKLYQAIGSDYDPSLSPVRKAVIDAVLSTDVQQEAVRITVPTLLIYGSDDTSTPPAYGEILHGLIPASAFVRLEGADHFVHQKNVPTVATQLEAFLKKGGA